MKACALALALVFIASYILVANPVSGVGEVGDSWKELAPMNQARGGLGVASVDGKIYAIGGFIAQGKWVTVGTNEQFDPSTNTWTAKNGMPTPRAFFAIAACQGKIYCIGGITDFSGFSTFSSVNEAYNPVTNSWETNAPMPTARAGVQANVVNGKIYLTGGMDSTHGLSGATEVYNPTNNTWTTKTTMPYATGETSAVVDNKIFSFGTYYNYSNQNSFSVTQIYSPDTDSWSKGAAPPDNHFGGEYGAAGVAASTTGIIAPKRIYVYCGDLGGSPLQVYNPQNDSWTLGTKPPLNQNFGVAVVDDVLYFVGGYADVYANVYSDPVGTVYASNEQYTPVGYGTVPPEVFVTSPEPLKYTTSKVTLNFTTNKAATWVGYSLDGKENSTITSNTTLTGLSNGAHTLTLYANDTFGNAGASQTIAFTVAKPEPSSTATVAVVSGAVIAVVAAAGLFVYVKKRKHKN